MAITWRSVQRANFGESNQLMQQGLNRLSEGFNGLGQAGQSIYDAQVVAGSKIAQNNIARFTSSDDWAAALKSGNPTGVSTMYMNENVLNKVGDKRSALLSDDSTIQTMEIQRAAEARAQEAHRQNISLRAAAGQRAAAGGSGSLEYDLDEDGKPIPGTGRSRSGGGTRGSLSAKDVMQAARDRGEIDQITGDTQADALRALGDTSGALGVASEGVGTAAQGGSINAAKGANVTLNENLGASLAADRADAATREEDNRRRLLAGLPSNEPSTFDAGKSRTAEIMGLYTPEPVAAPVSAPVPVTPPVGAATVPSPVDAIPFSTGTATGGQGASNEVSGASGSKRLLAPAAGQGGLSNQQVISDTPQSLSFGDRFPRMAERPNQAALSFNPPATNQAPLSLEEQVQQNRLARQAEEAKLSSAVDAYKPADEPVALGQDFGAPGFVNRMSDYLKTDPMSGRSAYDMDMESNAKNALAILQANNQAADEIDSTQLHKKQIRDNIDAGFTPAIGLDLEAAFVENDAALRLAESTNPLFKVGGINKTMEGVYSAVSGDPIAQGQALATYVAQQLSNQFPTKDEAGNEIGGPDKGYTSRIEQSLQQIASENKITLPEAASIMFLAKEREFQLDDTGIPFVGKIDDFNNWISGNDPQMNEELTGKLGKVFSAGDFMRKAREARLALDKIVDPYKKKKAEYAYYNDTIPEIRDEATGVVTQQARYGFSDGAKGNGIEDGMKSVAKDVLTGKSLRDALVEAELLTIPKPPERAKPDLIPDLWKSQFVSDSAPIQRSNERQREADRLGSIAEDSYKTSPQFTTEKAKELISKGASAGSEEGRQFLRSNLEDLIISNKLDNTVGDWVAQSPAGKSQAFDTFQQMEEAGVKFDIPDKLIKEYRKFRGENPTQLDEQIIQDSGLVMSVKSRKTLLSDPNVQEAFRQYKANRRNAIGRFFNGGEDPKQQEFVRRALMQALKRTTS